MDVATIRTICGKLVGKGSVFGEGVWCNAAILAFGKKSLNGFFGGDSDDLRVLGGCRGPSRYMP